MVKILRTLLLLALFALAGEAMAMPCEQGGDRGAPQSEHDAMSPSANNTQSETESCPCSSDSCHSGMALQQDCSSDCRCCSGACAGVIPPTAMPTEFARFNLFRLAYLAPDSSQEPETVIRPPILS
ncbi:hypothetical protein ACNKU7_16190 [Microbulbifer sp. SA54]|uniref:hypothetical protein n=1 Tax=Microbulbifer sp. SA54 TaxID=3401577 RepID=UPI003AAE8B32